MVAKQATKRRVVPPQAAANGTHENKRWTKSAAIREMQRQHPAFKPRELTVALKAAGVAVTPQFVSTVLSNDKRHLQDNRRVRKVNAWQHLLTVKKFVEQVGGFATAREALHALEVITA